jgi:hypothetical protein
MDMGDGIYVRLSVRQSALGRLTDSVGDDRSQLLGGAESRRIIS